MRVLSLLRSTLALVAIVVGSTTGMAQAGTISQWNFNNGAAPSTGTGVLSLVGGATLDSSTASGSTNDAELPNYAYSITTFPASNADNKTAGAEFSVNTSGYKDISVTFDLRTSNTASKYYRFQYSTDGINFIDSTSFTSAGGDTWNLNNTVNLSSITGANDNSGFKFRVVAEFDPAAGTYVAAKSSSTYATSGKYRFDTVTVTGTAVPEPSTLAIVTSLGLCGLGYFARRRYCEPVNG